MIKWFNRLKLATRVVTATTLILVVVVAVNYVVFARGYRGRAEEALVEKAKAFSAVADEAKTHTSVLFRSGAFDIKTLGDELTRDVAAGKPVDQTRFFKAIPVVAGWTAAKEAAAREKVDFRILAFDARNANNTPKPGSFEERLLRDLTAKATAGESDFVYDVDESDNSLHFLRAIRLTEDCLTCHGAPGSQYDTSGTGKDPTGHRMESWVVGQVHGSYHVKMPLAPVSAQVRTFIFEGILWTLPIAVVALGLFIYVIIVSIRKPVQALTERTADIAAGRLGEDIPASITSRTDEIGVLGGALSRLRQSLLTALQAVSNSSGTLTAASSSLGTISQRLAVEVRATTERSHSVAAAAEEASANTASVASGMEHAAMNLESVASATEEMSATVADIASHSAKARTVTEEAAHQAAAASALVQELGAAAHEIGKVTETITSISDQTNLLALNATIEAARAGAAGKGFAVVATEIKELARQTAAATEDIKNKVAGVQTSTGSAIAEIDKIAAVISDVVGIVTSIAAAIEEQAAVTRDVAGNVSQASNAVREAKERVAETATVSTSIAQDVAQISDQNRAIGNDSHHVQEDGSMLSVLSNRLKELADGFDLGFKTDFTQAKQGHLQIRARLIDMFEGRDQMNSSQAGDPHQCALGRWLQSDEGHALRSLPSYESLSSRHKALHAHAGKIIDLWESGSRAEAQKEFERFMPLMNEVFNLLDAMTVEAVTSTRRSGTRT